MRKLVYFIGVSIDGMIASPTGEAGFYPLDPDMVAHVRSEFPETMPTRRSRSYPATRGRWRDSSKRRRAAWTSGCAAAPLWPGSCCRRSTNWWSSPTR